MFFDTQTLEKRKIRFEQAFPPGAIDWGMGPRQIGDLEASGAAEMVDPFGVRSSGYSFLEEMLVRVQRAGFRIAEVPIVFQDRTLGASKINRSEIYRAAWHVLVMALRGRPGSGAGR